MYLIPRVAPSHDLKMVTGFRESTVMAVARVHMLLIPPDTVLVGDFLLFPHLRIQSKSPPYIDSSHITLKVPVDPSLNPLKNNRRICDYLFKFWKNFRFSEKLQR